MLRNLPHTGHLGPLRVLLCSTLLVVGLAACGRGEKGAEQAKAHPPQSAGQKADRGAKPAARGRHGGKDWPGREGAEGRPPVPVAIEAVHTGPIASYYAATATLAAEKQAQILARVTGVVMSLGAEEGDWVKGGKALLEIDDSEYRLRVAEAEAKTASLRDRYNRLKGMWEQKLVSPEEFEGVRHDLRASEAAEGLARLNLSYATVTAPFSGRVVSRLVDVGQNVSPGTALFVVADFDPLLAVVHVPSKEFRKLKENQPVEVVLDSDKRRLEGRIKLVSPVIDPSSGTIKITVEIREYPRDTRPGDFAQVSIVTERRAGSTLVPNTAVFTDHGEQVVFVAVGGIAERRVVEVGFQNDTHIEILSGVAPGENVVVKGQRSLKHGAAIKVLGDETTPAGQTERAGP